MGNRKGRKVIDIEDELHRELKVRAAQQGVPLREFVEGVLAGFVKGKKPWKPSSSTAPQRRSQ